MVFIHSRSTDDTTVEIIQWLIHHKKGFFRLNTTEDISSVYYDPSMPLCSFKNLNGEKIDFREFTSFYFNDGSILIPPVESPEGSELDKQLSEFLKAEISAFLTVLLEEAPVERVFGLSLFSNTKINKVSVMRLAKEIGFSVPETVIASTRERVIEFKQKWTRMITKSIDDGISVSTEKVIMSGQRTEEITDEIIDKLGVHFFPSLFQQLVEKQYEIRTFYFRDAFYSIAIFPGPDYESSIDWRNNRSSKTGRKVPCQLPLKIEVLISALMKRLGLNYGSIDLIYTKEGNYCFLEVNPYGQYGFVSKSGNYYIEKMIAEYL